MRKAALLLSALLMLFTATALAQTVQDQPLRKTILALDKALFDALNACDLETWKHYLADDIEFYQDNDNVTTTREQLEPSFMDRCGPNKIARLRRELVVETVEVHPIQGYGAVQLGSHRFFIVRSGEPDQLGGTPKFVHLWRNAGGVWQITRVISYGH